MFEKLTTLIYEVFAHPDFNSVIGSDVAMQSSSYTQYFDFVLHCVGRCTKQVPTPVYLVRN